MTFRAINSIMYVEVKYVKDKKCKYCSHYIQHYSLSEGRLISVYCGHCTLGRVKRKMPDSNVCTEFQPKTEDSNTFVTKEYLHKKLLDKVLSMELLPPIEER